MRERTKILLSVLILGTTIVYGLGMNAVNTKPVTASHLIVVAPDNGCSLFVSIPNPCDPDSAN